MPQEWSLCEQSLLHPSHNVLPAKLGLANWKMKFDKIFLFTSIQYINATIVPHAERISRFTESKGRLYWAFLSANFFRGVIVSSCDFMVSDHRGILCSISAPESYSFSPYWTKTPTRLGPFCAWRETANLSLLHMQKCNLSVDSDTYSNCY